MELIITTHSKERMKVTDAMGNFQLDTNIDTLGASLSFDLPRNVKDKNYAFAEKIEAGNIVEFYSENKNIFTGVIIDIETSNYLKSIKCLDFYFYLNKNKVIKQFNGVNASVAIEQLLKLISAPIGTITSISTKIDKIYKNNTIAEIIKDILEQVNDELGKKYIVEIENNKFNLIEYKKIKVKSNFNFTSEISITESIDNMKNKIIVVSNEQEEVSIFAKVQDEENIKTFGMLQEIIEVDPDKDDVSKVRNIAKTKLKELNKVFKNASLSVFGNFDLKASRLLEIYDSDANLSGSYLIKSCSHKYLKGQIITDVEIEVN